jgi:hypothetical protein
MCLGRRSGGRLEYHGVEFSHAKTSFLACVCVCVLVARLKR